MHQTEIEVANGSFFTIVHAATLKYKLQIKLAASPSHSVKTMGSPVLALTSQCHASSRVVIIMIIIIIMSAFPYETCSIALNRCKYKNTNHMHIRHLKQQVSKQSCSNMQLSSIKKKFLKSPE